MEGGLVFLGPPQKKSIFFNKMCQNHFFSKSQKKGGGGGREVYFVTPFFGTVNKSIFFYLFVFVCPIQKKFFFLVLFF